MNASQQGAANRRKGRAYQTLIRNHLAESVDVVEVGGAGLAGGDLMVIGAPNVWVEVKSGATHLGPFHRQARDTCPPAAVPVVVHKRHGVAAAGEQWVTMRVDDLIDLIGGGS